MKKSGRASSYSNILKYTGLFGGVQALNILVGMVRNKLVALLLGPQGMGLMSLFNSTIKLVGDSTNFGIAMSGVKNISEAFDAGDKQRLDESVQMVRSWCLLTAILGCVLCAVLSPWLSKFTFSWDGHTLHFILLSPAVFLSTITGGELAILKGIRRLRDLAKVSVWNVLLALLLTVPLYYFFRDAAIVPSIVLMALTQLLLTIGYSYRLHPLRLSLSSIVLGHGVDMVKLGVAFVLAGIFGSLSDFLIRSYLNNVAQIEAVGLFNAGYMMTMTYIGMVFSAMETDYFPRLSGVSERSFTFSQTVNRQAEVMLLMAAPLLIAFSFSLPLLLPLLYSHEFMSVLGMMQVMVIAMYFRAIKLPVQYIPLAKGDSRSYLLLEGIYSVMIVIAVVGFFSLWGLTGAGFAISLVSLLDLIITFVYAYYRYHYHPSSGLMRCALRLLPLGFCAYAATFLSYHSVAYWVIGGVLFLVSMAVSLHFFRSNTDLMQHVSSRFFRFFHHAPKN